MILLTNTLNCAFVYDDVYISKKGKGLTKTLSLVIGHIQILIHIYLPINCTKKKYIYLPINRPGNYLLPRIQLRIK